jgi:quinol monooxygenase YgiN
MGKFAIVATIKTAPGKREKYLEHLKAHAQRLATEPGTLKFEILVSQGGGRHGHAVRGLCKPGGLR